MTIPPAPGRQAPTAQDRAAPHRPHAPHQHDQAQDAARQHDIPGGRTPGQ
ncbi:hypothetical protein [Streptomyces sp. A0958]|nr:hypothetical protein [Streptomyces sp. A0958]